MTIKQKKGIMSDEELMIRFKESEDPALFGTLYHRYIPLVYGLCLKYLEDKEAAQDAVMDVFEMVLEKLPQYEVNRFSSWLYSVAKNHCLQVIRKEKRTLFVKIEDQFMESEDLSPLIEGPKSKEKEEALLYCMETLPEKQKKSIRFFYLEEKSYADIVDLTGFSLNNVKSYIQNGKRNLKSCIVKVLNTL